METKCESEYLSKIMNQNNQNTHKKRKQSKYNTNTNTNNKNKLKYQPKNPLTPEQKAERKKIKKERKAIQKQNIAEKKNKRKLISKKSLERRVNMAKEKLKYITNTYSENKDLEELANLMQIYLINEIDAEVLQKNNGKPNKGSDNAKWDKTIKDAVDNFENYMNPKV